jgi:hypothetical protein
MAGSKPKLSTWERITVIPAAAKAGNLLCRSMLSLYSRTNHTLLSVISLSFALVSYPFSKQRSESFDEADVSVVVRQRYKSISHSQRPFAKCGTFSGLSLGRCLPMANVMQELRHPTPERRMLGLQKRKASQSRRSPSATTLKHAGLANLCRRKYYSIFIVCHRTLCLY